MKIKKKIGIVLSFLLFISTAMNIQNLNAVGWSDFKNLVTKVVNKAKPVLNNMDSQKFSRILNISMGIAGVYCCYRMLHEIKNEYSEYSSKYQGLSAEEKKELKLSLAVTTSLGLLLSYFTFRMYTLLQLSNNSEFQKLKRTESDILSKFINNHLQMSIEEKEGIMKTFEVVKRGRMSMEENHYPKLQVIDKIINGIANIVIPSVITFAVQMQNTFFWEWFMDKSLGDKIVNPSTIQETLDDVAGAQEAKDYFEFIIEYMKNPKSVDNLATLPRGILLCGDPGNGKTMLARALAKAANCKFIYISGSSLMTAWQASGANNLKRYLNAAKKNAPCIVFIDEFDSVGSHRGGGGKVNDDMVNQLLVEMDGFNKSSNIVVIAAINNSDVLDKAVTSRFTKTIHVDYPNYNERIKILENNLKNKKHSLSNDDLKYISEGTTKFSGRNLVDLIVNAGISAIKNKHQAIELSDFKNALSKNKSKIENLQLYS